jgi:beta-glucosidase
MYAEGRLTELAAPLYFKGLCADGEEEKVAARLLRAVREKGHRAHFGILGAKWVPRVLAEYGHADDAFRLFVQPETPGWANWLRSGHGTLHETWDSTSSLNHIMFGDLSAWAYEYAAGIVPLEPGFRKVAFRPHVLEGVDSFVATHRTPHGEIRAGWRRVGGKVEYICEVPDGVEVEGRLSDSAKPAYRNPSLPTDVRVKDLLSRMTTAEKCAQLGKLRGFGTYDRVGDGVAVRPDVAAGLATNCPGTVYGILRADWWSGRNWQTGVKPEMAADAFNAYQRIAVEQTRLGIPIFFVEEAPHGLMALGEPVYPTGLGLGSTFDADLMQRIGRQIGRARSRGVHCVYAPILDIARDPRWSRCEECFGEDPELVAALGFAEFEGLKASGMEPCLKHYVGGGSAEGGHNTASAHIGPRELYNEQLRPFRRCIAAGSRHLMCTYHDVDGEPCTGSRFLLTDVLRGQLGFDGFVTADGGAIGLVANRRMSISAPDAAAMALTAGCDGESGSRTVAGCGSVMRGAFDAGLVAMADIDRAVGRILRLKFDMGLFEEPYAKGGLPDRAAEKALALEAARKSLVLLENRRALPLGRGLSVAVVGPNADDKIMNQLGDYTAPQRRADVVTVLDGVKAFADRVSYAKGCGIRSKSKDGFAEAERLASEADVTVLVIGGSSSPYAGVTQSDALGGATVVTGREDEENDKDSGEGTDRSTLGYSGVQEDLFRAVRAKAKKLIVVLVQGRPLVVDEIAAKADAVLLAWYPGSMGGQAVAEALYGAVNPSGRLPVAIPRSVGQLPVFSGAYADSRPLYIDGPGDAAYPFGYGLSYTTFAYSGFEVKAPTGDSPRGEALVTVANTGSVDGDEIVRLYFCVKGSGRQRPHRELLAFCRVTLKAGESRRVALPFDGRLFGGYGRDGAFEQPRGKVVLSVDGCDGTAMIE